LIDANITGATLNVASVAYVATYRLERWTFNVRVGM